MIKPFIPWGGGKRALVKTIMEHIPKEFGDYYEPFLGGGAMLLNMLERGLCKNKSYGNDTDQYLINLWKDLRDHPAEVIAQVMTHKLLISLKPKEYYDTLREEFNNGNKTSAIYWCLVSQSFYNIPRFSPNNMRYASSCKNGLVGINYENARECSKLIQNLEVTNKDYRDIQPKKGDFVYLDPPYTKNMYFTTHYQFSDLVTYIKELHHQGAYFILSNFYKPEIVNPLNEFKAIPIHHFHGTGRNKVVEVLITNI